MLICELWNRLTRGLWQGAAVATVLTGVALDSVLKTIQAPSNPRSVSGDFDFKKDISMKRSTMESRIGIVSGVGPLAGADVLKKVFQHAAQAYGAVEDIDYPEVVLVNRGVEGVDSTGMLNDEFKTTVGSMVRQLEASDATIIGIACNTAHVYFDSLATNSSTKLINLIDQVAFEASKTEHRYLLLTSAASKQQRLYHEYLEKYGVSFMETTPEQQDTLDEAIRLVMAYKLEEAGKLLDTVLSEAKKRGFEAVIAGCTELPIAVENAESSYGLHVIDSNYALAKSLVDDYYS